MRAELGIKLVCAECGAQLACPYNDSENDLDKRSRMTAGSAYEEVAQFAILPCENCKEKYSRPARYIAEALKAIQSSD